MAQLGVRKFDELIGRSDLARHEEGHRALEGQGLDFARIFHRRSAGTVPRLHSETRTTAWTVRSTSS